MFSELIKNFERVRAYLREFLVYGFRTREEVGARSARSYDNERRRLESWLGEWMSFRRTASGKAVFFAADSRRLPCNPLYAAFKAKSFTDADLTLYFLLMDLLADRPLTLGEIEEGLLREDPAAFEQAVPDSSTVRKKLEEYAAMGLIERRRQGRAVRYVRAGDFSLEPWAEALAFFSETAPCGVVGSFLLDLCPERPSPFCFKHRHLTQAMESEVLCDLLLAMGERREVEMRSFSRRGRTEKTQRVVPLAVFVSVQSGRRHLMAWSDSQRVVRSYRLDYTAKVRPGPVRPDFAQLRQRLEELRPRLFGVQTGGDCRKVSFTVRLLRGEGYVADRLRAEARCGKVEDLGGGLWRFTAEVCNDEELVPWMRTFFGRMTSFRFSRRNLENRFRQDLEQLYALYEVPLPEPLAESAAARSLVFSKESFPHPAPGQEPGAEGETGGPDRTAAVRWVSAGAPAAFEREENRDRKRGEPGTARSDFRDPAAEHAAAASFAEAGRAGGPLFHEVYGRYFRAVGAILGEACRGTLTEEGLTGLAKTAFAESPLTILPALKSGRWPLLFGLSTPLKHPPRRPVTLLERRFLRALGEDPRLKLFGDLPLPEAAPLFGPEDLVFYDRRTDGDPYEDPAYREIFAAVLRAVRERLRLTVSYTDRRGYSKKLEVCPLRLEYSLKDDRFRLLCGPTARTLNLCRIREVLTGAPFEPFPEPRPARRPLQLEITDERNALERVLLHFADLEKRAERLPDDRVRVELFYDSEDETELLIRVLSFGPMVRVTTPAFARLIRERLTRQRALSLAAAADVVLAETAPVQTEDLPKAGEDSKQRDDPEGGEGSKQRDDPEKGR